MDEVYNLETYPLIPTPFAGEDYLSAEISPATTILHFAFCILHLISGGDLCLPSDAPCSFLQYSAPRGFLFQLWHALYRAPSARL